ncbi:hypothetical protein AKO1_013303 [Acrasis kona]|uniref:DUF1996 domain-containing protein n=1 Tax=Acrasis kona TaxID=1008807 RepID=A0AAW2YZH6_9EUKA
MNLLASIVLLLVTYECVGFWRLPCNSPVIVERTDPIVNPGTFSTHMHTVVGGINYSPNVDYATARKGNCSSCLVKEDMSNYWVPNLYYMASNGTFTPVKQVGGMLVYYLQRGNVKNYAFPEGLRMLAGNPMLRSYNSSAPTNTEESRRQRAISFACIDYSNPNPEVGYIPNKNCPQGLRAQVFFPSCWDGVNLDSPDHRSHMAYPSLIDNGDCPTTHPKRLVSIFYEVMFSVNDFKDMWWNSTKHPFVFSNGDPTGYGYHGDFLNGWDVNVLQKAVDNCNAASGVVEECGEFSFFTNDQTNKCKAKSYFPEKVVKYDDRGYLKSLPGCNPVQYGPQQAVMYDCDAELTRTPSSTSAASSKVIGSQALLLLTILLCTLML